MKLHDIVTGPWAITQDMLDEIQSIYATHMRGEKINIDAAEKRLGVKIGEPKPYYEVVDGVAVIPVDGPLAPKMNIMSQISGGTSYQVVGSQLAEALADPTVKGVVLSIDSPGGTVAGMFDLSDQIIAARIVKPIAAHTSGMAASAAYMLAAACGQVFISSDATRVGSIGVLTTHRDISRAQEMNGVKVTVIQSGKYKAIGHEAAPLSEEGRAVIQADLDYLYSAFVNAVAEARGMTTEQALAAADGKIFTGKQAIAAGLVDGVSTLQVLINNMSAGVADQPVPRRAVRAEVQTQEIKMENQNSVPQASEVGITAQSIRDKHPEVYETIRKEARASGMADGARAERERILAIQGHALPGHEALVAQMVEDGKTTGDQAAARILAAEKSANGARLEKMRQEAHPPVPFTPAGPPAGTAAVDPAVPLEDRIKAEWDSKPEIRAEFRDYDRYAAFRRADEKGLVKHYAPKGKE